MHSTTRTVRQSYINLRGLNLGVEFVKECSLQPGQRYPFTITGIEDEEPEGTLDKFGFIGGLAVMYHAYNLVPGDSVNVSFDGR